VPFRNVRLSFTVHIVEAPANSAPPSGEPRILHPCGSRNSGHAPKSFPNSKGSSVAKILLRWPRSAANSWIAVHETDPASVHAHLRQITRKQRPALSLQMQNLVPGQRSTDPIKVKPSLSACVSPCQNRIHGSAAGPLPVVFVKVNRRASESLAPLDHRRVVMRMRNRDRRRCRPALESARPVSLSMRLTQSQRISRLHFESEVPAGR